MTHLINEYQRITRHVDRSTLTSTLTTLEHSTTAQMRVRHKRIRIRILVPIAVTRKTPLFSTNSSPALRVDHPTDVRGICAYSMVLHDLHKSVLSGKCLPLPQKRLHPQCTGTRWAVTTQPYIHSFRSLPRVEIGDRSRCLHRSILRARC